MQDTFWIDVIKALIGTFIGAVLAFGFAMLIQWLQRRRARRHAGFEATFELARMIQAFANLRRSFLSDLNAQLKRAPGLPPAMISRPSTFRVDTDIGLDLKSLSFLLDGSDHNRLVRIDLANTLYHDLAHVLAIYNATCKERNERVATAFTGRDEIRKAGEIEQVAGFEVLARLESALLGILEHFAKGQTDYFNAVHDLTQGLREFLPQKQVRSIPPLTDKWELTDAARQMLERVRQMAAYTAPIAPSTAQQPAE